MARGRIQKLLLTDEYSDFEDAVTIESVFIELDKSGEPIRQVFLGLTRDSLILASEVVLNYKLCPWVIYNADVDVDTEWMELEWIVPVCYLELTQVPNEYILKVEFASKKHLYFLLSNIGGNEKQQWKKWADKIKDLKEDPYGHIKELQNKFVVPLELYDTGSSLQPPSNNRDRIRRQSRAFDILMQGGAHLDTDSKSSITSTTSLSRNPSGQFNKGRRRGALLELPSAANGTDDNAEGGRSFLDLNKLQVTFADLQRKISASVYNVEKRDESSQTEIKSVSLSKHNLRKALSKANGFENKKASPKRKQKFGVFKSCWKSKVAE